MKIIKLKITKEFARFVVVGVINTLIHLSVLYILTEFFSVYYILSSLLAFLVAVTNSFIMNTLWTFKRDIKHKTITRYGKFFLISIISSFSNLFFLYLFTELFGIWYMFSQIIAIGLTLMMNFIGYKFWIFKEDE
ncbi:MAG TPA: GtrA family protein [Candidatus Paceibacterota bacterium]|nr:GtrA family protein [Candidatus Paceibacterota bacterium]